MPHPPFGNGPEEVVVADGIQRTLGVSGIDADQLEEAPGPGNGGVDGVPGNDEGTTGPEHPGELGQRAIAVHQVERLCDDDRVDGTRSQRQGLRHRTTATPPAAEDAGCATNSADGSIAITLWPSANNPRVICPEPAPMSTTVSGLVPMAHRVSSGG